MINVITKTFERHNIPDNKIISHLLQYLLEICKNKKSCVLHLCAIGQVLHTIDLTIEITILSVVYILIANIRMVCHTRTREGVQPEP